MRSVIILSVICLATAGAAQAGPTTFATVPVNIADAPVLAYRWHQVTRTDFDHYSTWRSTFGFAEAGILTVGRINPGRNWLGSAFGSRSWVLGHFEDDGFDNFGRVESLEYAGRYWGYIATANLNRLNCVVGLCLKRDHSSADIADEGGRLYVLVLDCSSDAQERYAAWKRWFQSFKPVRAGYNAALDD